MPVSPNSTQRLFAQLQSANAIIESLGVWRDPTSKQLHLQENPAEVAQRLATGLVKKLGLASALVWFYDTVDETLHIQATAGLISPAMERISQLVADDSPIGALVSSRAPKLSNNLKEEPWIQSPQWIDAENLVGFAGYPITLGTDLMGCVAVFSHTTLEPEFLEVLQFISTHTASAIATARQAQQLRRQANRDAILRAVGQKLRQAVGVAELLHATVESVGEAFNADRVRVTLGLVLASKVRPKFCLQAYSSSDVRAIPVDPQALTTLLKTFAPSPEMRDIGWFDLHEAELVASGEHERLRQNLCHAGYRTLVTVPIVLMEAPREEVMAHLYLGWRDRSPLNAERREWLKAIAIQVAVALNKARLLEQFQRQAERQALLYRMTDRIRFSLNLDEILQAAVTEIGEALQASRAQFLFGDSSLESVAYRYAYAFPGVDSWLGRRVSLKGNALAVKLFRPDEAIVIQGWSSLYEIEPKNQRALYNAGVQSLIVAGMNLGQDHYGILSVHRCRPDYYQLPAADVTTGQTTGFIGSASTYASTPLGWTDADRKLLKAVAEQLTIAINQSRLYEKTQQQAKRESLLNEISADIRNSLDPTQVLESIEQSLAAALELEDCKIQLYDNSSAPPSTTATTDADRDIQQLDLYETLTNGYPLQLTIDDFQYISEAERQFFQLTDTSCCALLPLLQAGELMGTILMTVSCEESVFPHEKFLLAIAVAEQAGIALKQAQLYDRARRLAQRETLLRQLAQSLTGTSTVGGIIEFALKGMADALGVNRCEFITLSSQHSQQTALSSEDLQQQIGEQIQRNIALSTKVEPVSQPAQFKVTQRFEREDNAVRSATTDDRAIPKVAEVISDLSWLLLITCYGQRDSLTIEDVRTYPIAPQARQNLIDAGIAGLVAVPVTIEAEVLGVLCATMAEHEQLERGDRRAVTGFATAELELLGAIADMTAVAVQRTQFSEQARMQDAMAAALRGLSEGREAESKRLAADLHDQTIADLGAMSRKMRQLANDPELDADVRQREISSISQQLKETIAELRCIVEDLQPTAMRAFNLGSALRSLLERAAQRSSTSLLTRFDDRTNGELSRLEPLTQSTLFRIVQEALNNVVKHAGATRVDCSIRAIGDRLEVKVIDNGRGMPDNPTREGSHGLLNMRYRAELIGGEISWKARKTDTGTIARLVVPLPN
ncbi:MAG: GAF domain-containing sensor histidine kinase [Cyanobacteria bacterium P01_E01_bin.45]